MTAAVSKAQIGAIHALKQRARLDDADYRDLLAGVAGVASSKDLSRDGAMVLIDRLRLLAGDASEAEGRRPKGALELSGPYAGICRALWISGWNLGVIAHREDTALLEFVRGQTRIDHINWMRDAQDGARVIEALKAWLARDAGVDWTRRGRSDRREAADRIIEAQLRLLRGEYGAAGALVHLWMIGRAPAADKTRLMRALGAEIRRRGGAR